MVEFPFQLLIKRISNEEKEFLMCTVLLRVVPDSREIYDAQWGDRSVVAKVFFHKVNAWRHFKKECRGLRLLQERGLSSPELLFTGRTEEGRWVVVAERIEDSSTVLDALGERAEQAARLDLLVLVCSELAKQHDKGVLQKDLHLGNFLLSGDKVFAVDAGQMRFFSRPITRRKSICQLAMFVCCLPSDNEEFITRLCEEYFKIRGWRFGRSDEVLFERQRIVHRKRGVDQGLRKCLRTSKRYLRIKTGRYLAVFERGFCEGAEPFDFIEQIDSVMDKGRILKDGRTCYVSRAAWNGKDVVVKRYNHKGFIHSLRHTIKRSRARRGWLHAHRLRMLNIATPRPLAYIERYKGPLLWESYLVTGYVEGQKLYDFLRDSKIGQEERSRVTGKVRELLNRLGEHRISHGDLKHSNILITDNSPILTDLDGMKVHKKNWTYQRRRIKDHARLLKDWPEEDVISLQG